MRRVGAVVVVRDEAHFHVVHRPVVRPADALERHLGDVLVLVLVLDLGVGHALHHVAGERGQPHLLLVRVGEAVGQVVQLVEPDHVLVGPGADRRDALVVLLEAGELQVEIAVGRGLVPDLLVELADFEEGQHADGDEHGGRHRGPQNELAAVGVFGRPGLLGGDEVDRQSATAAAQVEQADEADEAAALVRRGLVGQVRAGERVEQVDGQLGQVVQALAEGGVVGTAGDVDGADRLGAGLSGVDGQAAAHLGGQVRPRDEGAGQQQRAAAGDADLGPGVGHGQDGDRPVGRLRRRRQHGGSGQALDAGGDAERPRRHGGQLEPGRLAQLLVGADVLALGDQDQGAALAAGAVADGGVIDDGLIDGAGQLLDRLEADDGRLLVRRHRRVADVLDDDAFAAEAGEHRGGGDLRLGQPLLEAGADGGGVGGRQRRLLGPGGRAAPRTVPPLTFARTTCNCLWSQSTAR